MSDLLLLFADQRATPSVAGAGPLKRTLTVDNTGLAQALTDYPVKVTLTNLNFDFTEANTDGGDLRLYSDAALSAPLKFDVESWDLDAETAVVFVKVPTIPASSTVDIYMRHQDSALSDASDPQNTYTFFDGFDSANKDVFPAGSDSGWSCGFDSVSRRIYYFGLESHQSKAWQAVCWLHLDSGDLGFAASLPTLFNKRTVVYHPTKKLFYLYGGRDDSATKTAEIVSFDPATGLYATLTETLPAAAFMSGQGAVYCPTNGKIYLFGLDGANILAHDTDAGTVTDTGADLPFGAMTDISAVWAGETQRIYLVGGGDAGGPGSNDTDRIDVYDPASPSTNPQASGITLSEEKTSTALGYYEDAEGNGFIYVFGGFRTTESTYSDVIEKITVGGGTESIATLSAKLYQTDDDAIAFWDPSSGRVVSGPWIHSTGVANEDDRKMVFVRLDPTTDTLDAEPALGGAPSGWTEVGNSALKSAAFGSMLRLYERGNAEFVRAEKVLSTALSGEYMIEWCLNPMTLYPVIGQEDSDQISLLEDSSGLAVFRLNNNGEATWYIDVGPNPGTTIASRDVGTWQILGALVDTANEFVWGLKDRANKTAQLAWDSSGIAPDRIWMNTSTAGRGAFVVDWVKVRNASVTAEPTVTVGAASPV